MNIDYIMMFLYCIMLLLLILIVCCVLDITTLEWRCVYRERSPFAILLRNIYMRTNVIHIEIINPVQLDVENITPQYRSTCV